MIEETESEKSYWETGSVNLKSVERVWSKIYEFEVKFTAYILQKCQG